MPCLSLLWRGGQPSAFFHPSILTVLLGLATLQAHADATLLPPCIAHRHIIIIPISERVALDNRCRLWSRYT